MKILDLFCGGGGISVGYHRAGLDVEGVDINKNCKKNYPFKFYNADAIDFLLDNINNYDVIHASPPCQGYSKHVTNIESRNTPRLISTLRDIFIENNIIYIIENVVGAKNDMINPIELCGTMFNLPIRRHRLFETNLPIEAPKHPKCIGVAKQYAEERGWDYRDMSVTGHSRYSGTKYRWMEIMDIDWNMTCHEIVESIPPAYSEYLGYMILGLKDIQPELFNKAEAVNQPKEEA